MRVQSALSVLVGDANQIKNYAGGSLPQIRDIVKRQPERAEKIYTDRLYAGLDWLLPHKSPIEKHLKERLGSLFDLEHDLLLYDVTSTYFEGQCAGNGSASGRRWGK